MSAAIFNKIERAIAEEAVKRFGMRNFMTGKIGALRILKKTVTVFHGLSLLIDFMSVFAPITYKNSWKGSV